jgi:endonuclease-3
MENRETKAKSRKPVGKILELIAEDCGFDRTGWDRDRRQKWEQPVEGRRRDPFKSLIGTVLSARTRDENTARATESLFSKYDTPEKLADAPIKSIEKLIRKSGFYKTKARYIRATSRMIVEKHGGRVPDNIKDLIKLPGVGYKVGACVMVYSFGYPEIPVDTHVARVSQRIGITKEKNPDKIRLDLMAKTPKKHWILINELFVTFGKRTCKPIGPLHYECPVRQYCDFYKNLKGKSKGNLK